MSDEQRVYVCYVCVCALPYRNKGLINWLQARKTHFLSLALFSFPFFIIFRFFHLFSIYLRLYFSIIHILHKLLVFRFDDYSMECAKMPRRKQILFFFFPIFTFPLIPQHQKIAYFNHLSLSLSIEHCIRAALHWMDIWIDRIHFIQRKKNSQRYSHCIPAARIEMFEWKSLMTAVIKVKSIFKLCSTSIVTARQDT